MTYQTNSRCDLPGFGDCAPPDYSKQDARHSAIEEETEVVVAEWLADARFYQDYDAGFSAETWLAIQKAFAERDDIEAGRLYRTALREQMLPDARRAAEQRIDADIANAKRDAEEERGMARTGW